MTRPTWTTTSRTWPGRGTRKTRMEEWWGEFVDEKAIPIVKAHEEDLMRALEELFEEGARSPKVRQALSGASRKLAQDPEFKALVRGILEDALVRPFDGRSLARRLVADAGHRQRLRALRQEFAPTLRRITRRLTTHEETSGGTRSRSRIEDLI